MIDNYAKAMELIENIKSHLPITSYPTQNLLRLIQQKKIKIPNKGAAPDAKKRCR